MKKILALLLALVCLVSLVACSGNQSAPQTNAPAAEADLPAKELTDDEKATLAVENFMDAFMYLDIDEMRDYIDDDTAFDDIAAAFDKDALMDAFTSEWPAEMEPYASDFEGCIDIYLDAVKAGMDYSIEDVEDDGDQYVVTIELTLPDLENIDMEAMMNDALDEDAFTNLANDLLESGKLDENSSEEDIMEAMMPEMVKLIEDAFKTIEFDTTTDTFDLVVGEDDGEWIIIADESEL